MTVLGGGVGHVFFVNSKTPGTDGRRTQLAAGAPQQSSNEEEPQVPNGYCRGLVMKGGCCRAPPSPNS